MVHEWDCLGTSGDADKACDFSATNKWFKRFESSSPHGGFTVQVSVPVKARQKTKSKLKVKNKLVHFLNSSSILRYMNEADAIQGNFWTWMKFLVKVLWRYSFRSDIN